MVSHFCLNNPQKCPFDAILIINLPRNLAKETTHRYGVNSFKLHRSEHCTVPLTCTRALHWSCCGGVGSHEQAALSHAYIMTVLADDGSVAGCVMDC